MIKNNIYKINSINNKKICLLADIHLNNRYDYSRLLSVYENIKTNKPDYICIAGDILDDAMLVNNKIIYNRMLKFLSYLATFAPVIFISGNHDEFTKKTFKHIKLNNKYEGIKLNNVYYLNNNNLLLDNINFCGFNLYDKKYNNINKNIKEDVSKLVIKDKYNILLSHSPYILKNKVFAKFDLILCGHMHNGLMPSKLDRKLKNFGIISPTKILLPKRAKGNYKIFANTDVVISGGIVKLSLQSKLHKFNNMYKSHVEYIYI